MFKCLNNVSLFTYGTEEVELSTTNRLPETNELKLRWCGTTARHINQAYCIFKIEKRLIIPLPPPAPRIRSSAFDFLKRSLFLAKPKNTVSYSM